MEYNRREVLKKITAGGALISATAGLVALSKSGTEITEPEDCKCTPQGGPRRHYFPNVEVITHESRRGLFYQHFLRGKIVMINFMSIETESIFKPTAALVEVQQILNDRLGQDVFLYSVTISPEKDTVEKLHEFATDYGVKNGWHFLTGTEEAMLAVRNSLFTHYVLVIISAISLNVICS